MGAEPQSGQRRGLAPGIVYVWIGYHCVIAMDGQHAPDEIPGFVACFASQQPDLIIGYRRFREMPFVRRLANTLGFVIFSWAMEPASGTTNPATGW